MYFDLYLYILWQSRTDRQTGVGWVNIFYHVKWVLSNSCLHYLITWLMVSFHVSFKVYSTEKYYFFKTHSIPFDRLGIITILARSPKLYLVPIYFYYDICLKHKPSSCLHPFSPSLTHLPSNWTDKNKHVGNDQKLPTAIIVKVCNCLYSLQSSWQSATILPSVNF